MQDLICIFRGIFTQKKFTLQTIWSKFEDFCKPQSNAVHARFNLLTTFRQGNRSIDEWYNAVLAHILLCEYPKETAAILTRDIFWFFMVDNEFIAKAINEGKTDLEQYPAAKVQQMAKSWNPAKPLPNTLNSIHPIYKVLLKWMSYVMTKLVYCPKRKKAIKDETPAQEPNGNNPTSTNR